MADDVVGTEIVDGGVTELPQTGEVVVETPAVVDPVVESSPTVDPAVDPVNKRFSDVTKERDRERHRAAEAERNLSIALEALERSKPKPAPVTPEPVVEDVEPQPPEFIDPEQYRIDMAEYTKAVTARAIKQELKAAEADRQRQAQETAAQQQQQQMQQQWQKRREQAMKDMPDYVEVAERADVPISQAMAVAIATNEHGPKIAYHLGQHPEVAEKIAGLPIALQLMELGKLEVQLTAPTKPQVTQAPPPIKPLTGTAVSQAKTADEMSMEEYAASRRKSH